MRAVVAEPVTIWLDAARQAILARVNEAAQPDETEAQPDAIMAVLWTRALEAWDDDKVHLALLDHAMRTENLPDLAGRYRAVQDAGDETKAPIAKKRLDAIVVAATHMLLAMKSAPREGVPRSITLTTLGICACLIALLAYAVMRGR